MLETNQVLPVVGHFLVTLSCQRGNSPHGWTVSCPCLVSCSLMYKVQSPAASQSVTTAAHAHLCLANRTASSCQSSLSCKRTENVHRASQGLQCSRMWFICRNCHLHFLVCQLENYPPSGLLLELTGAINPKPLEAESQTARAHRSPFSFAQWVNLDFLFLDLRTMESPRRAARWPELGLPDL